MTGRTVRLVLAAGVAACVALCTSCSSIQPPKVTLSGVEFEGVSTDGVEFTLLAVVTNVNSFGADIGRLEYRVLIDGTEIARGLRTDDVHVSAGETVEIGIPFTITWKGTKTGVREFLDGEEHEWRLKGSANVRKGAISKTFRFSETGRFTGPSDAGIDFGR